MISSLCAPTEAQRQFLVNRRNDLADALCSLDSERETIVDTILEMFYCWSETRRTEADKLARTASKYAEHIQDKPLWAIKKACGVLERMDTAWPPSPGELRAQVIKETQPLIDEAADLRRLLTAEVYTSTKHGDEAKRTVRQIANSFMDKSGVGAPLRAGDYRKNPDADAERALAEFNVRRKLTINHDQPIEVSDRLKAMLRKEA